LGKKNQCTGVVAGAHVSYLVVQIDRSDQVGCLKDPIGMRYCEDTECQSDEGLKDRVLVIEVSVWECAVKRDLACGSVHLPLSLDIPELSMMIRRR
jgi:hypothetical protein